MKNNSLITGAAALLLALTLLFSLISPAESSGGATQDAKLSPVGQIGGTAYDVYILGQYAYLVSGAAFAIFDVSNPAQPERLGYLLFPDKAIGVHAAGDYAYVVTESSLWVISTADKSNPVAVGQCALTGGTGQKVVAAGDYAYVAAYSGGLQTIQVSDPAHPTPVSSNTGIYGYSVYVSGGYLYLASRNLYIFSLADPAHPAQVGVYNEGERDVVVSGKYAYAIGGSLWVLDVSNPAAPTLVGEKDLSEWAPTSVAVAGEYVYGFGFYGHFFTLSISDPAHPAVTDSTRTSGGIGWAGLMAAGNYLYMANGNGGLFVYSLDDKAHPNRIAVSGQPSRPENVFVRQGYAYLHDNNDRIVAVSLADPAHPVWQGTWSSDGDVGDYNGDYDAHFTAFHLAGDYLYGNYYIYKIGQGGESGIQIYSLTDPAHPLVVGKLVSEYLVSHLFTEGDYTYVVGEGVMQVISVADKTHPVLSSVYTGLHQLQDIYVSGQYAYVIEAKSTVAPARLKILSVANPVAPVLRGACDIADNPLSLFVKDGYAYVTDYNKGLQIIDVHNPDAPVQVGSYDTAGQAEDVWAQGDYAFVADGTKGLRMISVADPAAPTEVDFYDIGVSGGVFADDNFVYLADRMGGLVILSYQAPLISGRVTDANNAPLAGMVISATGNYTALTNSSGVYTFSNISAGSYTLTPPEGYFWDPPTRAVTVPPDANEQNFRGQNILKQALPASLPALNYGDLLTYTVSLVYPDNRSVVVYDPIPTYTTYVSGSLQGPPGAAYNAAANAINGTLNLTANAPLSITFAARTAISGTAGLNPLIVNRACVYPAGGTLVNCVWSNEIRHYTFVYETYLPLVLRN